MFGSFCLLIAGTILGEPYPTGVAHELHTKTGKAAQSGCFYLINISRINIFSLFLRTF